MQSDEEALDALEAMLPALAGLAFAEARARMLASGQSVLESEDGMIYETFPDGQRRPVKRIDPPVPVVKGSRCILR
jgi:hypothetical protein